MIRVIVRILLLLWIQWVMIQVIERYETNRFFRVAITWIARITDPRFQTNRPLNVHHISLKINFKPLFSTKFLSYMLDQALKCSSTPVLAASNSEHFQV